MLRLTKKADYGLMALKYLAEQADASAPSAHAQSAKDIAEAGVTESDTRQHGQTR